MPDAGAPSARSLTLDPRASMRLRRTRARMTDVDRIGVHGGHRNRCIRKQSGRPLCAVILVRRVRSAQPQRGSSARLRAARRARIHTVSQHS